MVGLQEAPQNIPQCVKIEVLKCIYQALFQGCHVVAMLFFLFKKFCLVQCQTAEGT
jgi:hypothetical protein